MLPTKQIESLLQAYKDDLWLERRHKMDEILRDLEKLLKLCEVQSGDSFARSIRGMIEFLRFLERECTGDSFADDARQWSQLMNLMEISRKLNHKSVKFKDILSNRLVIEAKSGEIRTFNEQARLIRTTERLVKKFESDSRQVHILMRASWEQEQSVQQDELANILISQRKLESTLKPTIQNLQACMQNSLITKSIPPTQLETWSEKLNMFSQTTGRLCSFTRDYLALKRELVHLRPLVGNLEGSSSSNRANQCDDRLGGSMDLCKRKFEFVLRFEKMLEEELRKIWIQSNRKQSETKKESSCNNSKSKQIEIKLIKLLKPTKYEEFSSELYGIELEEALRIARQCRKLLDQTMSTLRLEFGRFYFVNDLELLTIISLDWRLAAYSGRPEHKRLISKLFNNSIREFLLAESSDQAINGEQQMTSMSIVGIQTSIGEKILLADGSQESIPLKKRVNLYSLEIVRIFNELQRKLQRCLAKMLEASYARHGSDYSDRKGKFDWLLPIQLFDLIERIKFTQRVENCFKSGSEELNQLLSFYETQLEMLSKSESDKSISDLTRSAAISLVIQLISTICGLIKHNVGSASDWNWLKTERYYRIGNLAKSPAQEDALQQADSVWVDPARQVVEVRLAHLKFPYKFDLLTIETRGHEVKRLIRTETSEHCFLVASQAIGKLKLGANPYGPAGSGKTETIKALGQLLGCQVIVHNCDQTNSSEALERLIWGLAHTGLWGCFDEFNRLSASTLSSVSGQLEMVQTSLRASDGDRAITVELSDGQMKSIDPNSAFFITMNPSDSTTNPQGRGYHGRRRLPANLRSLFLPIAMVRVQLDSIIREMLLAFSTTVQCDGSLCINASLAERLSSDLARWIVWMRSNLRVDRCEWDLRIIMTILARFFRSSTEELNKPSNVSQTMIKCIVKVVGSRLNGQHEIDLLARSLNETFDSDLSGAQIDEHVGDSLQRFEEQLEMRPGVVLLGSDLSAEYSLWRSVAAVKNKSSPVVGWFQLNPKSCCKRDLLGHFDEMTSSSQGAAKWHDGLLTKLVRDSLRMLHTTDMQQVWLVLSGPIDPDWIESLNSVLDDNRVMTLSSGERLNFVLARQDDASQDKCIKLIFETEDISNASPATISRLGLVVLKQISGEIGSRGIDRTLELQRANLTVVLLASEIALNLHGSVGIVEECLLKKENFHKNQARLYEFVCFVGSNSKHLIELLELVSASPCDESEQQYLVIHNLHLIQSEDIWTTRTFVELLLHVVVTMSYYDLEHNLKFTSPRLQIIVTAKEDGQRAKDLRRLLSVAKNRLAIAEEDLAAHNLRPSNSSEISFDSLIDWCRFQPKIDSPSGSSCPIRVIETVHQNSTLDLMQQLKAELSRDDSSSRSGMLEICAFDNSIESWKTIETLTRLIENKDFGLQETTKRRLILVDSLQMHLLDPRLKVRFNFLLNLVEFKGSQFESLGLRCLFIANATNLNLNNQDSDNLFWLELAAIATRKQQEARQDSIGVKFNWMPIELETSNQIECFLNSIAANACYEKSPLAEVLVDYFQGVGRDATPEQRRSLLIIYSKTVAFLRKRTETHLSLLINGLERLAEFDQMVELTRESRETEEVKLNEQKRHMETLIEGINKKMSNGRKRSEQLVELRRMQEVKSRELSVQRKELEGKLAGVLPKLESSKREINDCLRPEALNEIRSLRSPPKVIKDILEVLFLVLVPNRMEGGFMDWPDMKSYLTKFSLRDEMTTKFDFEQRLADERLIARLEREISLRRQSFQLDQAARASSAIVPIVKWLVSTCEYGQALVRVRPLTKRMRALEQEAAQLSEASQQLEMAQEQLDQEVSIDQRELNELESNYEQARNKLDSNKLHLDKAQSIRLSLAQPVERWRTEIEAYENLLDSNGESLHLLSLISAVLTLDIDTSLGLVERIEYWLEAARGHQFKLRAWQSLTDAQDGHLVHSFLVKFSGLLLESITDQHAHDLAVQTSADLCLRLDSFEMKQLDHVVKLLAIKLNLHLNSSQLMYISIDSDRSIDSLRQYLTHKQILCPQTQDLILVRPTSNLDLDEAWREALETSKQAILFIEVSQSNSMQILDILNSFLAESWSIDGNSKRVILFGHSTTHFRPDLRQLLRVLDLSVQDTQESSRWEVDIGNHLLEMCEPELASGIAKLESELSDRRDHVRKLELDLINKLMLRGRNPTNAKSGELDSENELVRLLLELDQTNKSLTIGIEQISGKLSALQAKRDKFQSTTKQLVQIYADYLAQLKFQSSFYHITPLQLVALFIRNSPLANPFIHIIEHVMCSMRANDKQAFLSLIESSPHKLLDRASLLQASKQAADLRHSLTKLIELPNATAAIKIGEQRSIFCSPGKHLTSPFRLAIALHDARKSSPQMELDEFFRCQQNKLMEGNRNFDCQYFKLYAGSTTGSENHLEEQLKTILSSKRFPLQMASSTRALVKVTDPAEGLGAADGRSCEAKRERHSIKCICIANAHLAANWINRNLLSVVEASIRVGTSCSGSRGQNRGHSTDCGQLVIIVLVAECELSARNRPGLSLEFDSNLLDEAHLKLWYDEIELELVDRWHLYQLSLIDETTRNEKFKKQLVLFHVVCQELTRGGEDRSSLERAWDKGQNYSFDSEQLKLAMKLLNMQTNSNGVIDKCAFCHHIETIVYGARMETTQDEKLLKQLVDRLLMSSEPASKNWGRFEVLIGTKDVAERSKLQYEFLESIIRET